MRTTRNRIAVCALLAVTQLQGAQGTLIDDATVQVNLPTNNFGGLPQLQVGASATALLRFSLADLPAGTTDATIQRATLRLFVNRLTTAGNIQFRGVDDTWSEKTVTYAAMPRWTGTLVGPITVESANGFVSFDVTAALRDAVRRGYAVFGGGLVSYGAEVFFDSKESTSTSQPAQLDIQLTGPQGPQGPQGIQGPQGVPGPKGDPGSSSVLANLSTWQVHDVSVGGLVASQRSLSCPANYPQLVSGGCGWPFAFDSASVVSSFTVAYSGPDPSNSNGTWKCVATNGTPSTQTLRIYVNCAK